MKPFKYESLISWEDVVDPDGYKYMVRDKHGNWNEKIPMEFRDMTRAYHEAQVYEAQIIRPLTMNRKMGLMTDRYSILFCVWL
jgi:hypothetical protein